MMLKFLTISATIQMFFLWLYLLVTKKIHHMTFSKEVVFQYWGYLVYSLTLTTILFLIISYVLYKQCINPSTSTRFSFIHQKLEPLRNFINNLNIFYKAYDIVFTILGTGSPYVLFVIALAKRILDYSDKKTLVIILSFITLPRIIIIVTFLGEILLAQQLHYYFYALYLLLIPLVFRLIVFMLKDVYKRVYPEAKNMVVQELRVEEINDNLRGYIDYKLKPEYKDINATMFFSKYYMPLCFIGTHMEHMQEIYINIHLFTLFFYYLLHIVGFSYILFYLI